MKGGAGNTLKDSFYKERLIKSSANSMYGTFNRTMRPNAEDSDDDLPENMTKMTVEEEAMDMKNHLKNFKKTSEGSGYAFVKFECTHKLLRSINVDVHRFRKFAVMSSLKRWTSPIIN